MKKTLLQKRRNTKIKRGLCANIDQLEELNKKVELK